MKSVGCKCQGLDFSPVQCLAFNIAEAEDEHLVQLFVSFWKLGREVEKKSWKYIEIPTVTRENLCKCLFDQKHLSTFANGILAKAKDIKQSTPRCAYKSFYDTDEGKNIVGALGKRHWADKSVTGARDLAFQQLLGIKFFQHQMAQTTSLGLERVDPLSCVASDADILGLERTCLLSIRIERIANQIDAIYKLYTSIYKDKTMEAVVSLLEHVIRSKVAHVLEMVEDNEQIGNKDTTMIQHILGVFLHFVFVVVPPPTLAPIAHQYRYEWSYIALFCHCIRHNCIVEIHNTDLVEISNTVSSQPSLCTFPRKLFLKVAVSMVNIVNMIVNDKKKVHISKEVCNRLNLAFEKELLKSSVVTSIETLIGSSDSCSDSTSGDTPTDDEKHNTTHL